MAATDYSQEQRQPLNRFRAIPIGLYSYIVQISCVLLFISFLTGCTPKMTELEQLAATQRHVDTLRMNYVEISHPFITNYLAGIRARLATRAKLKEGPTLIFLSRRNFAYSVGSGVVILSSQLIHSLSNEAQLAFVLAHELGHETLGHYELDRKNEQKLEQDADNFAVGVMALAGYDPRASLGALNNTHRFLPGSSGGDSHPKLEERMARIHRQILRSGWKPPGTLHKRDFYKLKKLIR